MFCMLCATAVRDWLLFFRVLILEVSCPLKSVSGGCQSNTCLMTNVTNHDSQTRLHVNFLVGKAPPAEKDLFKSCFCDSFSKQTSE